MVQDLTHWIIPMVHEITTQQVIYLPCKIPVLWAPVSPVLHVEQERDDDTQGGGGVEVPVLQLDQL